MSKALDEKWEVRSTLDVSYEIRIAADLLNPENPTLLELPDGGIGSGERVVVLDHNLVGSYGSRIDAYFRARAVPHRTVVVSGGEQNKTMGQVFQIVSALNNAGTLRVGNPPIAIGGGVALDIVGLAASLYRRGIPHTRVPTTLLSLVDVSVAAKTGVNFQGYRNRIGSYSPPPLTLVDLSFLGTVPQRQISNGAGEMLKLGLIKDATLFELLEAGGPDLVNSRFQHSQTARHAIGLAIADMIEELRDNLWEKDLRRVVDYGHSFSPLVEMRHVHDLLHGEAVTLDCIFSAVIALRRGHLGHADLQRILDTARGLRLPVWHSAFGDAALLWQALSDTVRHRNGSQNLPLMAGIGRSLFINDLTFDEVATTVEHMRHLATESLRLDAVVAP
ncbi:sedoheptulose 7-phosphate cyclase [Micromonospora sp. NBC_00421]|uniref:sedoheptulose 7-phosphate cyclase n=1 Tax=Micromonospora sp. NBC_00421 TaxID=2975976 RepID=UPI002E1BB53B